ncbi:MAG: glycoside hydrolase family 3 C-terminal domain-containing protein [Eubacteriales bacterium]|nr:glycoside hydrolase family 3 C-terminal domain-containing protein [Eubacteriales bacterium]
MNYELNLETYAALARQAAAEGCVLLENAGNALPLKKGERIAVYGRAAFNYYKSGLGSGGQVNTRYVVSILDALKACEDLSLDDRLLEIYEEWLKDHPYDAGKGWGKVPCFQQEMPVTEEMLACAKEADASVLILGRTAGEDQDSSDTPGSYRLTAVEEELLAKVCQASKRTIVLLNTGNILDMSWVEAYHPEAVLYVWQGGQEGGNGVLDVLTGRVTPCGKLTDTIARKISDYPSDKNFGDLERNFYQEDVYVGYRYFETFAPEKVLYPFGYGLSYTTFSIAGRLKESAGDTLLAEVSVTNTGTVSGKEVVQLYVKVPQGKLGNPARKLVSFAKTRLLEPGESEQLELTIPKNTFASYDDSGATGRKSCYVLEEGLYELFAGNSVRNAQSIGSFSEAFTVLETLTEAYAPTLHFERMKPHENADGTYAIGWETVPVRTVDPRKRLLENHPAEIPYTGDQGHRLADVLDQKISMDTFVAQLSDQDLIDLSFGEGMCSMRVTPGTASAFGGVTKRLEDFGIPAACTADGPSGIRMSCGTKAFSLPIGTALGCTFNVPLVEALFELEGQELRLNKVDSLLGPGMNIHRHPLNGRNFEYISEDPHLTGKICAAQIRGMAKSGIGSTIKHFCGNNQESARMAADSEISERALREIYLKGFEIAVREGKARSVMTSYGSVNGLWTAGSYDLCTTILRGEWGFDGIVMTDWWAASNYEGQKADRAVKAPMLAAQNDLYMVISKPESDAEKGDVPKMLKKGYLTRAELQRNAKNILGFLLKSPAILHKTGRIAPEELAVMNAKGDNDFSPADLRYFQADGADEIVLDGSCLNPKAGNTDAFGIRVASFGVYSITLTFRSALNPLAQLPVSVFFDDGLAAQIAARGTEGAVMREQRMLGGVFGLVHFIRLYYGADGLEILEIRIRKESELPTPKA